VQNEQKKENREKESQANTAAIPAVAVHDR